MTKDLRGIGNVVILDSGFCVLKELLVLRKTGVFAQAVIKKRRYWPKHVKGDMIKAHLDQHELSQVNALQGQSDGVNFSTIAMKDTGYTSIFMSTYSTLDITEKIGRRAITTNTGTKRAELKYSKIVANHYLYCGNHKDVAEQGLCVHHCGHRSEHLPCWQDVQQAGMKDFVQKMINNRILNKEEVIVVDKQARRSQRCLDSMEHELASLAKKKQIFEREEFMNQRPITRNLSAAGPRKRYKPIALVLLDIFAVRTALPNTIKTRVTLIRTS
jgi:Transposase IS4